MIKNLGKFKQWTGERFGGAKVTLQTEDFQKLEQETENRREGYELIIESVEMLQAHLLKKKTSPEDNKSKVMPFEAFGSCLYHYGSIFPEDSALGIALINLGQTETRIAALQEALAQEIKERYLRVLENGLQDYKEYDSLRKKLASRRLDYDSKLNRLNKAKKEKPELEQEMQASRIKYEDTEHDLIQKMAYIQEFENEHRDALFELVEAQCAYHNQAKELFETVKSNWGQGFTSDSCDMMSKIMVRDTSIHSIKEEEESIVSHHDNKSPTSSTDDYRTSTYSSVESIPQPPPPTNLPIRNASIHQFEKYRKALFDFNSQNNDEISFKTGDIIAVIDEIDKGWWLGEVNSKKGIFPVNYTEEYIPSPSIPTKEMPNNSNNIDQQLQSSPQQQDRSVPSDTTTIKTNLSRKRSTAIRAPPPPPPTARFNSLDSTLSSNNITSSSLIDNNNNNINQSQTIVHEEPASYINSSSIPIRNSKDGYLEPIKSHEPLTLENLDLPCRECDCHDYIENPFKSEQCNNCFHKH